MYKKVRNIMNPEERIKQIQKEITRVSIIDTSGAVMLGLGLFARFQTEGEPLHPLLANYVIVNGMIIFGSVIMVWGVLKMISLSREMLELKGRIHE